jgi:hypothetical protein
MAMSFAATPRRFRIAATVMPAVPPPTIRILLCVDAIFPLHPVCVSDIAIPCPLAPALSSAILSQAES